MHVLCVSRYIMLGIIFTAVQEGHIIFIQATAEEGKGCENSNGTGQ